jgi:2-keto-4-pentenoate hydratase/2-oxohepta-3-ene-1,7-dioic acid hydratase in catechol pathway
MNKTRTLYSCALLTLLLAASAAAQSTVTRYVRYQAAGRVAYGILEQNAIHELAGDLFDAPKRTGKTVPVAQAKLLAPVQPRNVIAVGLNYKSHLGERQPAAYPGLFAKYPTSIVGPDDDIIRPTDSKNVHYEGELVIVIGKRATNVSREEARSHVFGVTAGNDVSEREWQRADLQWFRAKGSDTSARWGPSSRAVSIQRSAITTRVNGEVRQQERTKDLIFSIETIVSYVSRYVTLQPGDVIFTGTPQTTRALQPGDVVEIEVEGVGVLRNRVTAAAAK